MDLRQLKYFVQIAESGNFSRAAEILRVAQPSLSQQMKNLEDELGVDLLVRHARGVTPTEIGQQLYDHARRILQEVDRVKDVVRSQSANPSGRVSVGLPTSACRGLSIPLINALAVHQPNITLHVVEAMTGYLDEFLQLGRLDVALLYDHKAFEHVAWTEMMVEDLMLFVPPGHPLAAEGEVSFKRMFELPIVLPGRPNVLRTVVEQFAARHDVVPTAMDCDSLPAIAKLVRQSTAFAIMPHFALTEEMARGEMVAVRIVDPTPSWRLSVVVSQRTMNLRGSEAVAQVMADVIAGMVEAGVWRARLRAEKTRGELFRAPAK
ncbi:MAG TPA: LysR family transcriptional regulator [Xanthobacteraceae bacterium]|jgi:DNA-binding transcriptional LysR family regulator|nr:MAG: LysR family transcriptional regulator [Rhizobiales bacterium 39-66-18]HQS09787.1 LysR family transcriptional regulator [Xanthobacteraceae bacterium]HQS46481.1 LysR family transcriptional regulator [Xanthobacteraceae bacterium]